MKFGMRKPSIKKKQKTAPVLPAPERPDIPEGDILKYIIISLFWGTYQQKHMFFVGVFFILFLRKESKFMKFKNYSGMKKANYQTAMTILYLLTVLIHLGLRSN